MNPYESALIFGLAGVVMGGILGYLLGDYHHWLMDRIRDLQKKLDDQTDIPEPPKPGVTMGAYDLPPVINNTDSNKVAGVVQTKTPELLDWEARQAIEKEVLGR